MFVHPRRLLNQGCPSGDPFPAIHLFLSLSPLFLSVRPSLILLSPTAVTRPLMAGELYQSHSSFLLLQPLTSAGIADVCERMRTRGRAKWSGRLYGVRSKTPLSRIFLRYRSIVRSNEDKRDWSASSGATDSNATLCKFRFRTCEPTGSCEGLERETRSDPSVARAIARRGP